MNKLLAFILIIAACWGCTERIVDTEAIDELNTINDSLIAIVDSLESLPPDTFFIIVIRNAEISLSVGVASFSIDGGLVAVLLGAAVNISDDVIKNTSIEFTITADRNRWDIISETIGYFVLERPARTWFPPDTAPFPYTIQYDLQPDSINYVYVASENLGNIGGAWWYFRIIVDDFLLKPAWQYGGIIKQ